MVNLNVMPAEDGSALSSNVDEIVAHAKRTQPSSQGLETFLRAYFAHVDPGDLAAANSTDLFAMAVDHLHLAGRWQKGTIAIEVTNPVLEVDGWEREHTIVRMVTDDMPFIVDSVTMELSRQGLGIHFVAHPVMHRIGNEWSWAVTDKSQPAGEDERVSFICIEVDRQPDHEHLDLIEVGLRRVLGDVRAAVADWARLRARMTEVAEGLGAADLPVGADEVSETRELLEWLVDNHFIFLGARDYVIDSEDGEEVLRIVPESGLGILAGNTHLGRPRPLSELAPAARERIYEKRLLNLTKAGTRSTVHRSSFLDYIGIKTFSSEGEVTGERRFLGLFSSEVYTHSVERVPRARTRVAEVIKRAGYPPGGHAEKRLRTILEGYPHDDLLQMDVEELFTISVAIAGLQERRRVRVFPRQELFGRFVSVLVFLPRDRYNTEVRTGIQTILESTFGGELADWDTKLSESVLARLRFVLRITEERHVDVSELDSEIDALVRVWEDGLTEASIHHFGIADSLRLSPIYHGAFSPDYQRAFDPRSATVDIEQIENLEPGELGINAYRTPGNTPGSFRLKLYRSGDLVSLTKVMPILTNLGVTVVHERPYEIRRVGAEHVWVYDFALEHHTTTLSFATASSLVEDAFGAVWRGEVEDDGLNRLVLGAGMTVLDVAVLRAYWQYLRLIGLSYSRLFVEQTLEQHPAAVRLLVDLFVLRFDPDIPFDSDKHEAISSSLQETIGKIDSLDQDRVLRRFYNLIVSTVRTTWAQRDAAGNPRPYLAFKLDPTMIDEMPQPRPRHEIFVYSPRFEGVHLRQGPVARGGLRWSDRSEDYRTEVLGLLKAQMVKNSVIVPGGAKGGFVLKRPPIEQEQLRAEVVECYKAFVSGLLDLTDNIVNNEVVSPPRTMRYDTEDPYLVVAADKGTATFSDIANGLAMERGFWLGDAFASGGSNGYDHKQMGITARGAWESVKRHFRELGVDTQTETFTVVGIGDMSGDVFGNGMLQSETIALVAAFDHRHIFIDPKPDPAKSYVERQRLFGLPRSSWADYDQSLISKGGGVYERSAKSITLSAQARKALGTKTDTFTPNELMSCVLKAPVQLLWNGGIGTYIKAASETHADVGDKANDRLRVNGRDLRCAVVGEGGNLGVTQRGRIEFARMGGRIFTDAIDNAGGVDCSDHEVNIKILLNRVVADGDMTDKQRNALLGEMTDEIAKLVLASNYRQALALSAARVDAASLVDVHARYIHQLESNGLLNRDLEALPDVEDLADRRLAGTGLTTPELAVLEAYSKNTLKSALLASTIPDDGGLAPLLVEYFPKALGERFGDQINNHQLRREIISNLLANKVVDRSGVSMIYRLGLETSAPAVELAAAHFAAWHIFDLDAVVNAVNELDGVMSVETQLAAHLSCRQLAERATRLLVRSRPHPFSALDAITELTGPVAETLGLMASSLVGTDLKLYKATCVRLTDGGADEALAQRIAMVPPSIAALDIVEAAGTTGVPLQMVADVHFAVADRLDLTWLRDQILALPRDSQWSTLARLTLRIDLYGDHRQLTSRVMSEIDDDDSAVEVIDKWLRRHSLAVDSYRRTMAEVRTTQCDITVLLVAAREVRNLIERTSVHTPVG